MKMARAISVGMLLLAAAVGALPAKETESANWTINYTDKNFLNGKAVFQLNIFQEGDRIMVDFDAVYNSGRSCAPEGNGPAKVIDNNTLSFTFQDSSRNAGTGMIKRAGEDV